MVRDKPRMTGTRGVFIIVTILIVIAGAKDDSFEIFITRKSDLTIKFQAGSEDVSRVLVAIKGGAISKVYDLEKKQDLTVWGYVDRNTDIEIGGTIYYQTTVWERGVSTKSSWNKVIVTPGNAVEPLRSIRRVTLFRDDFNHFDHSHYKIEVDATGGGNGEFQVYTPEHRNLYSANGYLYIKPTLTIDHPGFDGSTLYNGQMDVKSLWGTCTRSWNSGCHKSAYGQEILPPIMSGKVYTNAAIKYGRVNVRARLPKGDWLWPAIWLTPRDSVYGSSPRSGEIDVMESRGNSRAMSHGVNHGITQIASTLHWGPDADHNAHRSTHNEKHSTSGDWHSWHTYSLEWTAQHIICLVDDHQILRVNTPPDGFWHSGHFSGTNIWGSNKNAPFDQPFRLLLNVAVGGLVYFNDHYQYDTPKPWLNNSPHPKRDFWEKKNVWLPTWHGDDVAMLIDYIEMIQY